MQKRYVSVSNIPDSTAVRLRIRTRVSCDAALNEITKCQLTSIFALSFFHNWKGSMCKDEPVFPFMTSLLQFLGFGFILVVFCVEEKQTNMAKLVRFSTS